MIVAHSLRIELHIEHARCIDVGKRRDVIVLPLLLIPAKSANRFELVKSDSSTALTSRFVQLVRPGQEESYASLRMGNETLLAVWNGLDGVGEDRRVVLEERSLHSENNCPKSVYQIVTHSGSQCQTRLR